MIRARRFLKGLFQLEHIAETRVLRFAENAPPVGIRQYTAGNLAAILEHARNKVPLYAELMEDAGTITTDNAFEVLAEFPSLDKDTLQNRFDDLIATSGRYSGVKVNTSGGSTGTPARFVQDSAYRRWNRAVKAYFFHLACDSSALKPEIVLWGASDDVAKAGSWETQLVNYIRREQIFDAYDMSPALMRACLEAIKSSGGCVLRAYPESAHKLALYADENNITAEQLDAVVTTGGTLFPDMRADIGRIFGVPVLDFYGSREVGAIAMQIKPHGSYMVCPATQYVEVVDEQGKPVANGQPGRILVTCLTNFVMPLIRYDIGDMAVINGEARDGESGWQVLSSIEGRVTDHFRAEDGTWIYGARFRHLLFGLDGIRQYQWVQESQQTVCLRVVLMEGVDAGNWRVLNKPRLETEVRRLLGDNCVLELDLVDAIEKTRTGKHRYTISRIA